MNRDDIIRMARQTDLHERVKDGVGYVVRIPNLEKLERFAALVAAEKDKEIKRLQDLLYTQLGELTALRAEKQMRGHIKELQEQPR